MSQKIQWLEVIKGGEKYFELELLNEIRWEDVKLSYTGVYTKFLKCVLLNEINLGTYLWQSSSYKDKVAADLGREEYYKDLLCSCSDDKSDIEEWNWS